MNVKEVSELRRRFRSDKTNINYVRGAFVNTKKEIVSEFNQFLGTLPEDEGDAILSLAKKTLSGAVGRNLLDVSFSTKQVLEGEEHKLLMKLRDTGLEDEETVKAFYKKVIEAIETDENYLILLAADSYDVFKKTKDGMNENDSSEVFRYFVCAVCPVRAAKSSLSYLVSENRLKNVLGDASVCPPAFGFLFPAFDYRSTNIHNALYYTKDASDNHDAFVKAVFNAELLMPAEEQKGTFNSILSGEIADDLTLGIVEAVQDELKTRVEVHKESREDDNLVISKSDVHDILLRAGVSEEKIEKVEEKYDEEFGALAALPPANLISRRGVEVKTPACVIRVDPEHADVLETRVIDGVKYLLIRADETVEVNGVYINIQ